MILVTGATGQFGNATKVLWRLPKGDFTYADFSIQKLEYDIPEKF
jgi:hypothetical protein